ncbi:MAG: hypothetical protein MUF86_01225 [Akkermansiaceae bacterium]|jgi:hypothetical protein|nr:hypothetical protein [Akkermansiaceae bacterium]
MSLKTLITPAVLLTTLLALHPAASAVPIRFLPWDDATAARKLGLQNASGIIELRDLHPYKRSAPADATGSKESPLRLVAIDRPDSEGRPATLDIRLTPDIKSPLVLILPDARHATGLRTFIIEDNTAGFSWGCLRFINATGKELLVRLDKTVKSLPDKWTPVDLKPGGDARNMAVQIATREDLKTILYSAIWEHNPDIRKLIFVIPGTDVRTGPVEFKIIPEDRRSLVLEASLKSGQDTTNPPAAENP